MKTYNKISKPILDEFFQFLGKESISTEKEVLFNYGHDETENLSYPPEILVKTQGCRTSF